MTSSVNNQLRDRSFQEMEAARLQFLAQQQQTQGSGTQCQCHQIADRSYQGTEGIQFSSNVFGDRMQAGRLGQSSAQRGGQLTSEQLQQAKSLIDEARSDGTISQEERTGIGELLQSFATQAQAQTQGSQSGGGPLSQLSEEQRAEVGQLIDQARSDGNVTQEERDAIRQKVDSFRSQSAGTDRQQWQRGPLSQLSEEQRAEARQLIDQARSDGNVTHEERDAIRQKMDSFRSQFAGTDNQQQRGPLSQLSEAQRSEIQQLVAAARSDGQVTAEERQNIHQTIETMVGHSLPMPGQLQAQGQGQGQGFPGMQQLQGSVSNLQGVLQRFWGA